MITNVFSETLYEFLEFVLRRCGVNQLCCVEGQRACGEGQLETNGCTSRKYNHVRILWKGELRKYKRAWSPLLPSQAQQVQTKSHGSIAAYKPTQRQAIQVWNQTFQSMHGLGKATWCYNEMSEGENGQTCLEVCISTLKESWGRWKPSYRTWKPVRGSNVWIICCVRVLAGPDWFHQSGRRRLQRWFCTGSAIVVHRWQRALHI